MIRRRWRALVAAAMATAAAAADPATAAESLVEDQWYAGALNGQPSMAMQVQRWSRSDGTARSRMAMTLRLRREMGPFSNEMVMEQDTRFEEGPDGRLTAFELEERSDGTATIASGTLAERAGRLHIAGRILRSGRARPLDLVHPLESWPMSDSATWRRVAGATAAALRSHGLGLMSGNVLLLTVDVQIVREADAFAAVATPRELPMPMHLRLDAQGRLLGMRMDLMGMMRLEFLPVDRPPVLRSATLAVAGLVRQHGPAPRGRPLNRFRIASASAAMLPETPFQQRQGQVVSVRAEDPGSVLAADERVRLLEATPQLEIDDPTLRAWVAALDKAGGTELRRAQVLRDAVRTHIVRADLSQGDATALETYRSRRGDCTEHANLLGAALRIAGIPARVTYGAVFAQDLGGWVGHAWVEGHADGAWHLLDAAYPGIPRSLYLGMGSPSDGDGTGAAVAAAMIGLAGSTITVEP